MRAPLQVLVIPFRWKEGKHQYAILKVNDGGCWQFVAGGAENKETPIQAARRECQEETGLEGKIFPLDSMTTIPKSQFLDSVKWGEEVYVIPEYTFGLEVLEGEIQLSREHTAYRWVDFDQGCSLLKWDSNRNALWELHQRLTAKLGIP
jgi:dATP pyrophosphohydrolase